MATINTAHTNPGTGSGLSKRTNARRRVLNARLLFISLAVGISLFLVGYGWYRHRSNAAAETLSRRAAVLEKEGAWRDAVSYLNRYLQLRPDDKDARIRLITALESSAELVSQRRNLIGLLYQSVGLLPERTDLRLKLANNLLETGDPAAAEIEANKVLKASKAPSADDRRSAQKVIAMSLVARARSNGLVSIEQGAQALSDALKEAPNDAALAVMTAELYREFPERVGINDAVTKADSIIDRLVQANPDSDDALITRYKYRRRFQSAEKNARQDLEKVLARHPSSVEALYLLSMDEVETGGDGNFTAAEKHLKQLMQLRPADARAAIGLARLFIAQHKPQQAAEVLSKARREKSLNGIEPSGMLASALLDLNRVEEAEAVLKDFEVQVREVSSQLGTDDRIRLENAARLLRARYNFSQGKLDEAARTLNAILAAHGDSDTATEKTEKLQAHMLLGSVLARQGRIDAAAAHWKDAAGLSTNAGDAYLKAAAAYLELGRPSDAIRQLDVYLQLPTAAAEGWILLTQAHLQQQLLLASSERTWTEFLRSLAHAKQILPQRWEPQLAEVTYWQTIGTEESKRLARQRLKQLEETYPSNAELLARIAACYQQLEAVADASRVLERYEKSESNPIRRSLVRSAHLVQQGKVDEAAEVLALAAKEQEGPDRNKLQLARVQLLLAAGRMESAEQIVKAQIEHDPRSRAMLLQGIDVALQRGDFTSAAQWEDRLKELDIEDGVDWQFCRARRLVEQNFKPDTAARTEIDGLLESLRTKRPEWYPLVALEAQFADTLGNSRQAIDGYRRAIELGDRSPNTVQRLVVALYGAGRYDEANAFVSSISADLSMRGGLESLAIELAVKENRLNAALDLAKQALQHGPNDPMKFVWLASLQSIVGHSIEAEAVFKEAIQQFPKDARIWNALFAHLVRSKQPDRARRALEQWGEWTAVGELAKQISLGQGYELLSDKVAAQQHYRAAIAADDKNIDARLRLAKLLLASDTAAARSEFEAILKIESRNSEARRYLASLLSVSGADEDWNRAIGLLGSSDNSGESGDSIADQRLRAMLLSRRGRNREERLANCEAGRQILESCMKKPGSVSVDLDRLLIANIYGQEASIRDSLEPVVAARDVLRPLVDREKPAPQYLIAYIQLVLNHLERGQGGTVASAAEQDRRLDMLGDVALRIDALEAAVSTIQNDEFRYAPIALRLRLLAIQNQMAAGRALLSRFAQEQLSKSVKGDDRAKRLLQLANLASAAGYHSEAEEWCRQLLEVAPNSYVLLAKSLSEQKKHAEAVELCLRMTPKRPASEIAAVLTQVIATASNRAELEKRIQPMLKLALENDQNNVDLLMSAAVGQITADNYDEAIRLLRRILELQPKHALALNNLATLLAERPNELVEARQRVEQAMSVSGRIPSLLDTRGMINIRDGKSQDAVADLEEAVASAATDPRYYFHLAEAYQQLRRYAEAKQAFSKAQKYGIQDAILTAGDREMLLSLAKKLPTNEPDHK